MNRIKQWISDYRTILLLFSLAAVFSSLQSYFLPPRLNAEAGREYTCYNNYVIFKQSFYHLIDHKDLYILYPEEHWDRFKYSPTFSLLFGSLAILPDWMGLILWDSLNAFLLVLAVYYLPKLTVQQKGLILLGCIIETMTSLQNEQSNGLMAGLIILSFGLCERRNYFIASMCLVLSVYIKIFSVVGFALFLFYPEKLKLTLYTLFWAILLMLIPLIVVNFEQLRLLYESWGQMLVLDHTPSAYGFSISGWLKTWFHIYPDNLVLILTGAILFLMPFGRLRMYSTFDFRLLALSSVLIWVVIFNHMAESPTFVIAMAGVSIWFFTRKSTPVNVILFIAAILLTSLSSSDLFPQDVRKEIIQPYVLKAFPCIMIWLKIIFDMFNTKQDSDSIKQKQPTLEM